jgi:hypothetical protein
MVKKALLIGINYYNTPAKLNGCIEDIKNTKDILVEKYGYTDNNIVMLRDDTADKPETMPTKQNMLKALNDIVAASANCEEIWIHYSGHGSQIRDKNGNEADGLDEVIVPMDYTSAGFIVDDAIFNIVKNIKCRALVLFDSCHSGTVCDLQWSFQYAGGNMFKRILNKATEIPNKNIFMFSGCRDPQTSADTFDTVENEGVGAFTRAFLDALKDNSYSVALPKLYKDTCVLLKTRGFEQEPTFSSSSNNPYFIFNIVNTINPKSVIETEKVAVITNNNKQLKYKNKNEINEPTKFPIQYNIVNKKMSMFI